MKFPHKFQSPKSASCGPLSLWMVNEYYKGVPYTPHQLVSLCRTTARWGTDDFDLIEAAQKLGYDVQDVTTGSMIEGPVFTDLICYLDICGDGHWAVCTELFNWDGISSCTLQDPLYGRNYKVYLNHTQILGRYRLTPPK